MKILISWYAFNNDFSDGTVDTTGPTYQFHQYFFNHDKHIILSSMSGEDLRLDKLINRLALDFPARKDRVEGHYMTIQDIINMPEIKTKVEALLLSLQADQIDLFISPGTPAMQVAWYFCHQSLKLPTTLYQTRAPRFTRTNKPELVVVDVEQSVIPVSVLVKEELQDTSRAGSSDYLITPTLKTVYDRADKLAQTNKVTCLIQGASGTGKEHLARYIHDHSERRTGKFVAINCSAFGDSLLESRLFGYEKGAFTGAEKRTDGFFDTAKGGTLFLDEIGDITPYMQQSLLRVLQSGDYTPVGSTKDRKADVRIIAATHQSLREACAQGRFRWDLFYRLSVAELHLPTLSERGQAEKRSLLDHFLRSKQKAFRRPKRLVLSTAAYQVLDQYQFPGNVRELENLIESLYVFYTDTVDVADLPGWLTQPSDNGTTFDWPAHEKELIRKALAYFSGNKAKACAALGYGSINTLVNKIRQYEIQLEALY